MEFPQLTTTDGSWLTADRLGGAEIRFVGRGLHANRSEALLAAGGGGLDLAWCRQIHSARSVEAAPGECGQADALVTDRAGLALAVATADCVPVVVAGDGRLAAIHAGWRGIAASIVPKVVDRLEANGPLIAWLGPAVGRCCYEVDLDVAHAVVAASGPEARVQEPRPGKAHLDLHQAVACQLERSGVTEVRRLTMCTCCNTAALWSYRKDGRRAGRNYTFAWLTS